MSKPERLKVAFTLTPDEDGYPPYAMEHLWAEVVAQNRYKIDNIPFFVRGIAHGDVVTASTHGGGLRFEELVESSGHSTLRVIVYDSEKIHALRQQLRQLGCGSELSDVEGLIAVDIPPEGNYTAILNFLDDGC